jgi:hypothetical protein
MVNIKSHKKPNKYKDFLKFIKKYPHFTPTEIARCYHVTPSTINLWMRKMQNGDKE